jgi:hypothetical protein
MAYLGNTPTQQGFIPAIDYFSGDASTVAFTLSRPVASVAQVQATIENVPQNPGDAFTVSGNTITFTSAPPSGTNNIYVYYTSPITQVIQPGQGTVGATQMASGAAVANIGYTPVNKAGDTMTGQLTINGGVGVSSSGLLLVQQRGDTQSDGIAITSSNSTSHRIWKNADGTLNIGNSSGQVWLGVDTAGRVTTPAQPSFRVYNSSTISPSNGSTVVFNTAIWNIGSCYNTANGRFTAPVAGTYTFFSTARPSSIGAATEYQFNKNDSRDTLQEQVSVSTTSHQTLSATIYLSANDYVTVYAVANMRWDGGTYNGFGGYLVG